MKARELATLHARRACEKHDLQFLDQTVALSRMRPRRDVHGNPCWQRDYAFEYTSTGSNADGATISYRDHGSIRMQGLRLKSLDLPYVRDSDGNRVYFQ